MTELARTTVERCKLYRRITPQEHLHPREDWSPIFLCLWPRSLGRKGLVGGGGSRPTIHSYSLTLRDGLAEKQLKLQGPSPCLGLSHQQTEPWGSLNLWAPGWLPHVALRGHSESVPWLVMFSELFCIQSISLSPSLYSVSLHFHLLQKRICQSNMHFYLV